MLRKSGWGGLAFFIVSSGLTVSGIITPHVGYALMLLGGLVGCYALYQWWRGDPKESAAVGDVKVGNQTVVMGDVSGSVGDQSVVIGPTRADGSIVLNQGPLAVGHGAEAGPDSVAIGFNAGAGTAAENPAAPVNRRAGEVRVSADVSAGSGTHGPGGSARIEGGTGTGGASGGHAIVGPGTYKAGDGGPGGPGGDLIIKGGDAK